MSRFWTIAGLTMGCAGEPPRDPSVSQAPDAWVDPAADDDWSHLIEPEPSLPDLTAERVQAAIEETLSLGIPNAAEAIGSYRTLLSQGDEVCPGSAFEGGFEVFGECTSTSGVIFSGVAGVLEEDDRVWDGDDWTGSFSLLTGPADYTITRTDGSRLEAGGFINYRHERDERANWSVTFEGSWSDSAASGWLGAGVSSALRVNGRQTNRDDGLELDGSYTIAATSLGFDLLRLSSESCEGEVAEGTMTLRTGGYPEVALEFTPCTRCASATTEDGTELGEVCIDPAPLLAAIETSARIP